MFIYDLVNFLSNYSKDAIIVSIIVAIITSITDKFLTLKQKLFIKALTPFILGIMVYFLFNVICYGIVCFNLEVVYAGILCGSLSGAIYMIFTKVSKGESKLDIKALTIESIIKDYVDSNLVAKTSLEIINTFDKNQDRKECLGGISKILNENKLESVCENEIFILATLIYESYKSLNL